jgi:hypothetical protein
MTDFTLTKDGNAFLLRANSRTGQKWIKENANPTELPGFKFRDGAVVADAKNLELLTEVINAEGLTIGSG